MHCNSTLNFLLTFWLSASPGVPSFLHLQFWLVILVKSNRFTRGIQKAFKLLHCFVQHICLYCIYYVCMYVCKAHDVWLQGPYSQIKTSSVLKSWPLWEAADLCGASGTTGMLIPVLIQCWAKIFKRKSGASVILFCLWYFCSPDLIFHLKWEAWLKQRLGLFWTIRSISGKGWR